MENIKTAKEFEDLQIEREAEFTFNFVTKELKTVTKEEGEPEETEDKKVRYIEGYATTSTKDRASDIVTAEAIRGCVNDLLRPGSKTVFYNHDTDKAIGKVVKCEVDSNGLLVGVEISKAKDVDDYWTKIKEGILNSFSIRLRYDEIGFDRGVDGEILAMRILKMELYEVSVVGLPCNPDASIISVTEKALKEFSKVFVKSKQTVEKEKGKMGNETVTTTGENKKETIKDAMGELLPGMIQEALKGLLPELVKSLKPAETKPVEAPAPVVAAKADTTSEVMVATMKEMLEQLKSMKETTGTRKGIEGTTEGEENTDTMKKPLIKNLKDEQTIKYMVGMWVNNPEEYDIMSEKEKAIAKQVYFSMIPHIKDDRN